MNKGRAGETESHRQYRFLAEASRRLADSLDYETTLTTVAELALPGLGSWCIVDLVEPDGSMRRLAIVHPHPEKQDLAARLEQGWPPERDDPIGAPVAVRTRESQVVAEVTDELLVEVARDEPNLEVLRALGIRSFLVVPLVAHGVVLGAITFVAATEGRQYTRDDLEVAEDLATRCALAIGSARLYRESGAALDRAEGRATDARARADIAEHAETVLRARARESALLVAIGTALVRGGELGSVLQSCAEAMIAHLDAALARIWTLNEADDVLELRASAGMYTRLDGEHGRVPVGALEIGRIAEERAQHLTNDVPNDPWVSDPAWASREGMVAFAGYPLLVEGRLVGVMAMFARSRQPQETLAALGVAADSVALAIERSHAVDALRRSEARLREVFLRAPALIAVLRGPDHVYQSANELYHRLVGHRDIVGRTVAEVFPHAVEQGLIEVLDGVRRTGEPFVANELRLMVDLAAAGTPDEHFFTFVYQPLFEAEGSVSGILVHGVEVTEQVRARKDIDRARQAAEAANKAKSDFLAVMSHELRTPINAILGYTDLLLLGVPETVPEVAQKKIERVRASTQHLLKLIEEVLTFSKVEAGQTEVHLERVDLAPLAREVCQLVEPLASGKRLRLLCRVPEHPVFVETDAAKVRQILLNLLSNAIKFTDRGEVALDLDLSDGSVQMDVRDSGIGIEPVDFDAIFEPFKQVDQGSTRRAGGTGLGLSVSRQLARLLGGDVTVDSAPGAGSTFMVSLPRDMKGDRDVA